MLSLSKFLLLVVVIAAVWFGWRWVQRVDALKRDALREGRARQPQPKPRDGFRAAMNAAEGTEDMEKCPECGAYVAPRSAVSCGRAGCPYGR